MKKAVFSRCCVVLGWRLAIDKVSDSDYDLRMCRAPDYPHGMEMSRHEPVVSCKCAILPYLSA